MDELRRRFASLERLRTPDLWDEIELRAGALVTTEPVTPAPVPTPVLSRGLSGRSAAVLLVAAGLLVALVAGAVAVGSGLLPRPVDRDSVEPERGFVEPFFGLPPEGATPSTPQTGQLVLSVYGRMNITEDIHGIWVYADGRIIWRRSLDAHITAEARRRGFGTAQPTRAVIEQRLTPEGVEQLRSEVISAGLSGLETDRECGGPVYWAQLEIRVGDQLMRGGWCDPELPGRLADFASWLPASAWADQRIGGYVPSWYAVCVWSTGAAVAESGIEELLPRPTIDLLHSRGSLIYDADRPEYDADSRDGPGGPRARPDSCYRVTPEDARAIRRTLDDAGLQRQPGVVTLFRYEIADAQVPALEGIIDFYPILPEGDTVEYLQ